MSYNVFLSHNQSDKRWVNYITENAQNLGINIYMYEHDSQPGIMIADKIKRAIDDCHALVVLLTSNSQNSAYVQQEIGYAQAKQKLVIPLVQPGVPQKNLAMLQGTEYIEFNQFVPENALSRLLSYLNTLKKSHETDQAILFGLGALFLLGFIAYKNQ